MILERLANVNIFHKVRQLEAFSKSRLCASASRPLLIGKTTNFAGIQRCLNTNVTNSTHSKLLTQLPKNSLVSVQQSRMTSTGRDHVRLWVMERMIAVALPILLPASLLGSPVIENLLAFFVVMHTHWGLEAVIVDYARPRVVGSMVATIAHLTLLLFSASMLAGLLVLIYSGPGIAEVVKKGWAIGKEKPKST